MKEEISPVERPWGHFRVIFEGEGFKVKELLLEPGKRMSYQSHRHRSERWVVAKGEATVVLDGNILKIGPGGMLEVDRNCRHRLCNESAEPLIVIEVQLGDILEEEDILRYEDDYGRVS